MPSLDADVQLDISDAQSQVDALANYMQGSLSDALGSFDSLFAASLADLTTQVTALTEALQGGLQSAASDASAVGDALESGLSSASADVQDLDSSVSSLGDSASSAGGSVKDLGGHTEVLAGGAALATGEVGGLKSIAGDLAPTALGAAGGVLALTGGIVELYHAGLDAVSAEQRFNQILGDQAKAVEAIHVGDLNTGLLELTAKMGSTTAATQNAAATIFQFAQNAGAGRQESSQFTQELFALASRAVALKPSLGDVSDVATRMEIGLGRARSAAQQFGISVSQAEINTRALQDTGKTSAADLNAYEKSVAGAEIALERYGTTLKDTINTGSQNAAIQQRALTAEIRNTLEELGKPLVAPVLDIIRAGVPIIKDFGQSLALVAQAVAVIAPVLRLIEPAITPAIIGFGAFYAINTVLPAVMGLVEIALTGLATVLPIVGAEALGAAADIEAAEVGVQAAAGPIGLLVAVLGTAAVALGVFGGSADNAKGQLTDFSRQLSKIADGELLTGFLKRADDLWTSNASVTTVAAARLELFRKVANDNVGTGQRLIEVLSTAGLSTTAYQKILDKAVVSQATHKTATDASSAAALSLTQNISREAAAQITAAQTAQTHAQSLDNELKAIDSVNDALFAQYDANYASVKATDAARDAVDKINTAYGDAIKQGKSVAEANDAVRRATDDAGEALLRAGVAAEKAGEQQSASLDPIQKAHDGYVAEKQKLEELRDTLAPESPLRVYLQGYIDKLKDPALTGTYIAQFGADTAQAQANLNNLLSSVSDYFAAVSQLGTDFPAVVPTHRMAGGPVEAGHTYLVGEAGPELLTLGGVGGYVTPNHMILGTPGTSATGTTVSIGNISVTVEVPPGTSPADADAFGSAAGVAAARQIRAVIGAL